MIAIGRYLAMLACLASATGAQAAKLSAMVYGGEATPLPNAVVVAVPEDGRLPPVSKSVEVVDQIDKEFVPYVKAVRAGSYVRFPNKDNIRHHVYSFSPAKTFELPLYKGTPSQPVLFDKPGVVKLGCNIHDWMVGYLYVTETPYLERALATAASIWTICLPGAIACACGIRAWKGLKTLPSSMWSCRKQSLQ